MNFDLLQLLQTAGLLISVTVNVILSVVYRKLTKNINDLQQLKDYINSEFAKFKQDMVVPKDIDDKIELALLKHEKECDHSATEVGIQQISDIIDKHTARCEFIRKNYK